MRRKSLRVARKIFARHDAERSCNQLLSLLNSICYQSSDCCKRIRRDCCRQKDDGRRGQECDGILFPVAGVVVHSDSHVRGFLREIEILDPVGVSVTQHRVVVIEVGTVQHDRAESSPSTEVDYHPQSKLAGPNMDMCPRHCRRPLARTILWICGAI